MPFFLYFSFAPNYGPKWSHQDVFPLLTAESTSSLENRAKDYKNPDICMGLF